MPADERTEPPTPKRRREARRRGQVARSPEVASFLALGAFSFLAPSLLGDAASRAEALFSFALRQAADPTPAVATRVLGTGLEQVAGIVLPLAGLLGGTGILVQLAQTGLVWAPAALRPDLRRLDPLAGLRRLWASPSALWELGKQLAKLVVVAVVAGEALDALAHEVLAGRLEPFGPTLQVVGGTLLSLLRDVAAAGVVLGAADFAFQRRRLMRSLRMTKHEVKEELRQHEGDPRVKRELRRKQARLSRLRMMAAVAKADVVVANPTHLAVALRYEPGGRSAPVVVAKGAGEVARRIRSEAERHRIPVVEDPPLARALYAAVEVDEEIPRALYLAVARLLAFVFSLPPSARSLGGVLRRPTSALAA
jgi:flagellar biosynthetic protein FlhB